MKRLLAGVLMALAFSAGAAAAQQTAADPARAPVSEEVTLAPGDILIVQIWREPDLGGEFQVDLDGVVVLPLIGEKQVAGLPVRRLRQMLVEDYTVHLRNPSINITPLRRIHVLGEVRTPGVFRVDPTVTLAEAIALAGGVTEAGDIRRIRVIRGGAVVDETVRAAALIRDVNLRSGDQIYVDRRPWLSRNTGFLLGTALSMANLILNVIRLSQND
ncbi:MAG TPA: polysaccharide biosynthesis/export family protein [Longimicrobium sp.]